MTNEKEDSNVKVPSAMAELFRTNSFRTAGNWINIAKKKVSNYRINEYGEIIREDYFFCQVHGTEVQILPFERKVWKIYLLSLITFGIYGLVVGFAMAKETNISCVEDGKHTRGFWGVIGLSIITLGIYAIVWYCKWLNRESSYLKRCGKFSKLTGGGYFGLMLLQMFIAFMPIILAAIGVISMYDYDGYYATVNPDYQIVYWICSLLNIVVAVVILTKVVTQHNEVNKTYNEIHNFVQEVDNSDSNGSALACESTPNYFINLDNEVYGPFTLLELRNDYPISEDTLITTDSLNGEWYEAKCFECFDDLFVKINEFGEYKRI